MTISNHHMDGLTILGEAGIDEDGIVSGWCWCPERPRDRLTVEIFVNGEMVAMPVAQRFRSDLDERGFGDGFHGFLVAITTRIAGAGDLVVSARESRSGVCFWQRIIGAVALPGASVRRIAVAAQAVGTIAASAVLVPAARGLPAATLRAAFGVLGGRLLAGGAAGAAPRRVVASRPEMSVVLNAACVRDAVRCGMLPDDLPWAGMWSEYVLCDDGRDPRLGRWQNGAAALMYSLTPDLPVAARRNLEIRAAQGEALVFISAVTPQLGGALDALRSVSVRGLVVSSRLADSVRFLAPDLARGMTNFYTDLRLDFTMAGPRATMMAQGTFDPAMGDDGGLVALDWVLRAGIAGEAITVWCGPEGEPADDGGAIRGQSGDRGAGFIARWGGMAL